jgi:hypothetical protein
MAAVMMIDIEEARALPARVMQFRRALWSMRSDPDQIMFPGAEPEDMMEEVMKHFDKFFNIITIPSDKVKEHRNQMELQGVVIKDLNGRTEITPQMLE